ncbi:MAG: TonB-dependent receptor [Pseudomonadota bacterium]
MQKVRIAVLLSACSALPFQNAIAQDTAEIAGATRTLSQDVVVVTAQKREQNLQDVPISVTAVQGETLDALGRNQISELSRIVPGVSFADGTSDAGKSVAIRGVGTQSFSRGVEQAVGTVVDGVVADGLVSSQLDMSDVERLEVLRGPQGMLFGKNASAGVLNIVTNDPTADLELGLNASYAEENEIKLSGFVSGPLVGEKILARITGYYNKRDALVENIFPGGQDFNDRDEWGIRGKVLFQITDDLDATVTGFHAERDHVCCLFAPVSYVPGRRPATLGVELPSGPENDKVSEDDTATGSTKSDAYSLEINYQLGDHTLTSITGYSLSEVQSNYRAPGSPTIGILQNEGLSDIEQLTHELRVTSPADQLVSYVVGLYYFDREESRDFTRQVDLFGPNVTPAPGLAISSLVNNSRVTRESFSVFGQATINLTEALRLSFGLRMDNEEVSLFKDVGFVPGTMPEQPTALGITSESESDTGWSGRIIAQYDASDDVMVYASAARGYKGLGTNTLVSGDPAVVPIVDPEIPTSFELGLKSRLLDNRVTFNTALFHTTFDDFQSSNLDNNTPPGFFLVNAEEMRTMGVEVEMDARVTERLSMSGSLTYTDAEFTDFEAQPCYSPVQPECVGGRQDLSGDDIPNSPDWTYRVAARYDQPLQNLPFDGFVDVSWYWQSEVLYNSNQNPTLIGDSYGIADLFVGIADKESRYTLTVFAKNLFDKFHVNSLSTNFGFGIAKAQLLPYEYERRFGVAANLRF